MTHSNEKSIGVAIGKVIVGLKPGGNFIGSDWFSKNHSDFSGGAQLDEKYARTDYTEGPFKRTGKVHVSDEPYLRDLISRFQIVFMEEKLMRRIEPTDHDNSVSYDNIARKPHV